MATVDDKARPYRMISLHVSDICELTRWLLERAEIPFYEELHAPLFHIAASIPAGAGIEAPVVVAPTGPWFGKMGIIYAVDAHSAPGRKIFGETEAERLANESFLNRLVPPLGVIGRYAYHLILPNKRVMYPVASWGAPLWERVGLYLLYPLWRFILSKSFGDSPDQIAEAPKMIEQGMTIIEEELARRGTPFLGGEAAGGIDVVVSALLSPVIFPPQYGGKLPALKDVPKTMQDFVRRTRDRPAGRLALATYATARIEGGAGPTGPQ